MKRLMKMLAAVATIGAAMLAPFGAWADAQIIGELKWSYDVDGSEATVRGVERTTVGDRVEGTVTVPSVLGGNPVTVIGFQAFLGQEFITEVVLPDGITVIGEDGFNGCKRMTALTLPSTVRTIYKDAFDGCSTLKELKLNEGLTEIGDSAFTGCAALKSLTLPSTVQTLGAYLFSGLPLVTMEIPDSVTEIGNHLFEGCDKLESVVVGMRVPGLTFAMFSGCEVLNSVTLKEGYLDYIGEECFNGCKGLTALTLPSTVRTISGHAFDGCSSLLSVTLNDGLTEIGGNAFSDCMALHYVYFQGDMPTLGWYVFRNVKDRMVVYISETSTGFGDEIEGHLVKRISEKPANADAPYDFYLVTPTFGYYDEDAWPAPVIVTSERFEADWEVPELETTFREGDTLYLSYAYDEYWRGEAFNLTNRFTLSGAKSGTFEYVHNWDAHETADYGWKTNAVPELLQNLAPGNYTLSFQLNANNRLKETDYSNNSTSITFTVVSVPKYTVAFNLNGAPGAAPASRTIYEGKPIGELPTVTAPAGWSFLGWYTAASGGDEVEADTRVTANMTCFALWTKCDLGFYFNPDDVDWSVPLFVTSSSDGTEPMTSFAQGTRIYLKYGFRNLAGNYDVKGFVNRFALNTGVTFDDDWTGYTLYGDDWGWGGAYWYPSALQNLAPGSYTLTCTLDATGKLSETDEGNNTRSITFTIVSKDAQSCTVTFNANGGSVSETKRTVTSGTAVGTLPTPTRSGYTYDGWFTAASGGTKVTASTKVTANVTFYAHWTQNISPEPIPVPPGTVPTDSASLYEGILQDRSGNVSGTISVKVAKPNKDGEAKVTVTVISADGKKETLKSTLDVSTGEVEGTGLKLGEDAMGGTFNGYDVDGARSVFSSKSADDKAIAAAVYGKWPTASVAWKRGALTVTINKKGKAKISGSLVSGVKVSAKSQVLVGDEWLCVPVMWSKKGERVVFLLRLKGVGDATYEASVDGLGDGVKVGGPRALKSGAAFAVDKAALCSLLGSSAYSAYLPNGVSVEQSGTKWIVADGAKAGKVQLGKDGKVDGAKAGKNASGLKLKYKAKDGTFKGSFKAYADVNGKPKATTVSVIGVMVGNKGYGIATIKNKGGIPVSVE